MSASSYSLSPSSGSEFANDSSFSSPLSSSSEQTGGALYILLAIGSPVVFSLTNIVDKTAVSTRVKHTPSYIIMIGIVDMLVGLVIAACCDWSAKALEGTEPMDFIFPVISAFAWALFIYCYYIGMLLADASIIVGVEYLYPLVVLALSAIFLHERIQALGYLGIVLLVVGAISLSLNFIGMIHKKCKKNDDNADCNKERRVVLGSSYGPFQNVTIPAGWTASINDAGSPEEARAAFSAILGWYGNFVMPIMKKSNTMNCPKSYVDVEAGCASGVSCWFPCSTWCSSCTKVAETAVNAKRMKKKRQNESGDLSPEREKKKRIDSRRVLESDRNVVVRAASAAALNATVNRPSPSYDSSDSEKKDEVGKIGDSTDTEEVKDDKKTDNRHHHHHHHHHEHEDEEQPNMLVNQLGSSSSDDDDAIHLEVIHPEDDEKDGTDEEDKGDDGDSQAKLDHNCVSVVVDFCHNHRNSKGLLIAVLIPLIIGIALCEFLAKVSTAKLNAFNVCSINFFSFGFLMFAVIFVTPLKGAKYFISEVKRNWMFCILSDTLTLSGQFLLIFALSGMSASVVSSLAAIQPFCTLCLERVFGIASDSLKQCLGYKLLPVILIVAGVVVLSVAVI